MKEINKKYLEEFKKGINNSFPYTINESDYEKELNRNLSHLKKETRNNLNTLEPENKVSYLKELKAYFESELPKKPSYPDDGRDSTLGEFGTYDVIRDKKLEDIIGFIDMRIIELQNADQPLKSSEHFKHSSTMREYAENWTNPDTGKKEKINVHEYSFQNWEDGIISGDWKPGKHLTFNKDKKVYHYDYLPVKEYEKICVAREKLYWEKVENIFDGFKSAFKKQYNQSGDNDYLLEIEIDKIEKQIRSNSLYEKIVARGQREYHFTNSPNCQIGFGAGDVHHIRVEALAKYSLWLKEFQKDKKSFPTISLNQPSFTNPESITKTEFNTKIDDIWKAVVEQQPSKNSDSSLGYNAYNDFKALLDYEHHYDGVHEYKCMLQDSLKELKKEILGNLSILDPDKRKPHLEHIKYGIECELKSENEYAQKEIVDAICKKYNTNEAELYEEYENNRQINEDIGHDNVSTIVDYNELYNILFSYEVFKLVDSKDGEMTQALDIRWYFISYNCREAIREALDFMQSKIEEYPITISHSKASADKSVQLTDQPLPLINQITVEEKKKIADEYLKFFSGYFLDKKIMAAVGYNHMLEYVYILIETDKLPQKINSISTNLPATHIRYTFYLIHKNIYGTKHIHQSWITFLHAVFKQFQDTVESTTKKRFSEKPKSYEKDIMQK